MRAAPVLVAAKHCTLSHLLVRQGVPFPTANPQPTSHPRQVELAKRLVESSFADKTFFCNSGTEANEAAIKFARKYARVQAGIDPYDPNATAPHEIVSFTNCFHGRTMVRQTRSQILCGASCGAGAAGLACGPARPAPRLWMVDCVHAFDPPRPLTAATPSAQGALALTYKEQYKSPFLPVMPGHALAEYNNLESAAKVIQKGRTCAVFVEPVQVRAALGPSTPACSFWQAAWIGALLLAHSLRKPHPRPLPLPAPLAGRGWLHARPGCLPERPAPPVRRGGRAVGV